MNRNVKRWVQVYLGTLFFTCMACQGNGTQYTGGVDWVGKEPQTMNEMKPQQRPKGTPTDQQIKDATSDLATRIGVGSDAIVVREARSVQWRSGALGCPKPGMSYTQAIVPGVRLLLEAKGKVYHYHGRNGGKLFYCPAERAQAPAHGQGLT